MSPKPKKEPHDWGFCTYINVCVTKFSDTCLKCWHDDATLKSCVIKINGRCRRDGFRLQQLIESVRHKKFTKGKITLGKAGKGGWFLLIILFFSVIIFKSQSTQSSPSLPLLFPQYLAVLLKVVDLDSYHNSFRTANDNVQLKYSNSKSKSNSQRRTFPSLTS